MQSKRDAASENEIRVEHCVQKIARTEISKPPLPNTRFRDIRTGSQEKAYFRICGTSAAGVWLRLTRSSEHSWNHLPDTGTLDRHNSGDDEHRPISCVSSREQWQEIKKKIVSAIRAQKTSYSTKTDAKNAFSGDSSREWGVATSARHTACKLGDR